MNPRVVVTGGGSSEIAAAVAERLSADGYEVIVVDPKKPAPALAARWVPADFTDADSTAEAFRRVLEGGPVLRLVNGANRLGSALVEDTRIADLDAMMAVNIRSVLQATQAMLPGMRAAGFGRIVSIISAAALGKRSRTAYAATKSAVIGMSRTWAIELGPSGITANVVGMGAIASAAFDTVNPPGAADTDAFLRSIPLGRMGTMAEAAHAVAFFLDDLAGYVTGQALYVCGGVTTGRTG